MLYAYKSSLVGESFQFEKRVTELLENQNKIRLCKLYFVLYLSS